MTDDRGTGDYEVGYGKPPESGKFKEGVSGNPEGRPKKAPDFDSMLVEELNRPLTITENGKRKVVKKYDAIVKQWVNKALSGDIRAMRLVVASHRQAFERVAEREWKSPFNPNLDARDLTDEELVKVIIAHHEKSLRDAATARKKSKRRKTGA